MTHNDAIDVREAVKAAMDYFRRLFKAPVTLEEVELSEDGGDWHVTLGYPDSWAESSKQTKSLLKRHPFSLIEAVDKPALKYKRFVVDARTGRVKSMKIRDVG